ncbi:hypothetical protein E2R68_12095 [Psychromonas sp. RZ22]|uniref:relaxase/mobilization nuclease domain-containing protein n=1 Tax=Psychromonas algarum TaxID=2555643 RepID=UPI001067FE37|nr:hypothetical protein [Psychromonas sp. RZ22]TEW53553.1 hypothetical protein E2R68_12095 [Psychromonas sp. RZ22]
MAIAKILHEGEKLYQLKRTIKYNSVAKEWLNSADNPRLIGALSNLGVIDITDQQAYDQFMKEFIKEVTLNKSLSTNKRQTKLYSHDVVSFAELDNQQRSQDELTKISLEILNTVYDMDNTPYILWPQTDNKHGLHFHIVRSMYSNNGEYQRVKQSKLKLRSACEKAEKKHSLVLTGKNIKNTPKIKNDPMLKVFKNKKSEANYLHQKRLNEAINQDIPLIKLKRNVHNVMLTTTYQSDLEIEEQQRFEAVNIKISDKEEVNNELNSIKKTIFSLYKKSENEAEFLKQITDKKITVELLKHSKSGKNKGIVFHYKDQSISGGKISSSMTLGKIKQRFPNFINTLEKPPTFSQKGAKPVSLLDFHIEQINKYYKQRSNKNNGDILIYFGKKNVEQRPHNFNLKLSHQRDKISFGPATPNDFDLKLALDVALQNGWKGAIISNCSRDFLKRNMAIAYKQDPKLLFYFQSDKPNLLTYDDLKAIKNDLTATELKTAIRNNLICEKDTHKMIEALKEVAKTPQAIGFADALKKGFSIKDLDNKTEQELATFHKKKYFNTIKSPSKTILSTEKLKDGRQTALDDITKAIDEYEPLTSDVKSKVTAKINKP